MSKFKKKSGGGAPGISTASLPDIVFMLLFFFMVVTKLRDTEQKVTTMVPKATELTKFENKSLVNNIFIGRPTKKYQDTYGTKPRIQLDDKFATLTDIPLFLENHRQTIAENQRGGITTSMVVDGSVTMGVVNDVKTALRKANQLKLNYFAKPRGDE